MRKKSMGTLASLAPRRRERGTNRDRANEFRDVATPSVPALVSTPDGHGTQLDDLGSSKQTVDRLASALLESTIYDHPNGLASHPSVLLCGAEPNTVFAAPVSESNMDVDNHRPGVTPVTGNKAISTRPRVQSPKTRDMVPAIPRKSSRRRLKRTSPASTSALARSHSRNRHRPIPQSKTSTVGLAKKQDALPSSTTVPFEGRPQQTDLWMSDPNSQAMDPRMINDKVAAMLAATEALKPRGPQKSTAAVDKPSRFRPRKVMSKVRHAFDIFQPKPSTPESSIRGKISAPVGFTTCDLPNPAQHYHIEEVEQVSPVSSIEIRLNEGNNLNNHKVRSIVGGRILRKPVPYDGRSLRSGGSGSTDDPFSEHNEIVRTPTPFEHRLKFSVDSSSIPPVPFLNPFDSEKDFDHDLEAMLSEKPLCASTPRNRNDKKSVSLESPSKRYAKVDDGYLATVGEVDGGSGGLGRRKLKLDLSGVRLFHDNRELNTKKHPSPSKKDLDDLEAQFRAYAIFQIRNSPADERDALANKFAGLIGQNTLTPRDKNLPLKARPSKEELTEDFSIISERKYSREASVLSDRHSRIPRPTDFASRPRQNARFGAQRLPANVDALEMDELQWDVTSIGSRRF